MYIELENLICYIDSYSSAFFDPNTYNLYFENELPSNDCTSKMLQVPKVEERAIIDAFITQHHILRYERIDPVKYVSVNQFHSEINKLGLYDEWIDFRSNILFDIASKWCLSNNIKFTNKKCD